MQHEYRVALDTACEFTAKRDFGAALYVASQVKTLALRERPLDVDALLVSDDLIDRLAKLIEIEFYEYARRKKIKVSEENKHPLMREHSRHWIRFNSLLYQS